MVINIIVEYHKVHYFMLDKLEAADPQSNNLGELKYQ